MARPKKKVISPPYTSIEIIEEIAEAAEMYYRERAQGSVKPDQKVTFISGKLPKTTKMLKWVNEL